MLQNVVFYVWLFITGSTVYCIHQNEQPYMQPILWSSCLLAIFRDANCSRPKIQKMTQILPAFTVSRH